jgi:hypothetical protein
MIGPKCLPGLEWRRSRPGVALGVDIVAGW